MVVLFIFINILMMGSCGNWYMCGNIIFMDMKGRRFLYNLFYIINIELLLINLAN